jgi:secondary thiamine-phosphate synthase enzyme
MQMVLENHSFTTRQSHDFVDVTADLLDLVQRSGVRNGLAVVFSPHTTGAIIINEHESGFAADFAGLMDHLVPSSGRYLHDDPDLRVDNLEDDHAVPNGHGHCRHALLGSASQAIPIVEGELQLGRWQRVFFFECDRARERRVLMQVLGE